MFLKKKTSYNDDGSTRTYLQLVESRRVNGKPRQIVLMTLGRLDTEEGKQQIEKIAEAVLKASEKLKLIDLAQDMKAESSLEFGIPIIFKRLWEDLGLGKVLISELKNIETDFDINEAVFNMVLNRLSDPGSKRQLSFWQDDVYGIEKQEPQHYYRAMDYLIKHKDKIEEGIFDQMRTLFNQNIDVVLFDTTSLVYYGDSEEHEKLLDYGFSKARRSDLKQVVVGVIMSKDGVPLGHETFSGNTNDVKCFEQIIEKISKRFKIEKVILVGDRGMISQKNIECIVKFKYEYILGYRMRTISKEERSNIFSKIDLKEVRKNLQYKEVSYKGQRLLICYNEERAELDKKHREEVLDRLKKKLGESKTIQSLIDNKDYKKYLKIEGKSPKLDDEKIKNDQLYDGVYVLTTNTKMNPQEVITAYKDLWQVEQAFKQLKSELEMGPIYHWKDRRIQAHIMICFLSLVLRSTFYKKIRMIDKDSSLTEVLRDIKALHAVKLNIQGKEIVIRTELKPMASVAFKALKMAIPQRIISNQFSSNVVARL